LEAEARGSEAIGKAAASASLIESLGSLLPGLELTQVCGKYKRPGHDQIWTAVI